MNNYRVSVYVGPLRGEGFAEAFDKIRAAGGYGLFAGTERIYFEVGVTLAGLDAKLEAFYAAHRILQDAFGPHTALTPIVIGQAG